MADSGMPHSRFATPIPMRTFLFSLILLFVISSGVIGQTAKFTINGAKVTTNGTYNVCINNYLSFANTANGAYNFSWKFENGSPATAVSPFVSVYYSKTGTHKVWYSYTDNTNKDIKDSINIKVSDAYPTAAFSYSPSTIECGNTNFSFNSSASTGSGLSYAWTFGDGSKSTEANPKYAFTKAYGNSGNQSYSVNLVVTSNNGCTGTIAKTVTVKQVPNADITSTDEKTTFPAGSDTTTFRNCDNKTSHEFTFTNASTTTASNTEYIIDWGDGSPKVTMATWPVTSPLKHTFPRGLSRMIITVKNNSGCQTEKHYSIFVGSNPSGGFATDGSTAGLCAPATIDFKINNIQDNGSGTRYVFTVSDGSEPVIMQHPPADKVSHLFDKSSCGFVTNTGTNNAFYTTLSIENPCEPPTVLNISPIIVSGKPNPVIVTNPNICVNSNTTIAHNGDYGIVVTSSSCTNVGKQVWKISPATGYAVTGNLGSLNGDVTNSANWTDGSKSLPAVFTATGTYTLTLYMANTRCGIDSTTQNICVRNPPKASFTMDKKTGCSPSVVNITNTSPVGTCGGEKYAWSVSYADVENCGGSNGSSFTNGTDATSKDPQVSFSSPGRYIIELTVSTQASGCAPVKFQDTFFVKTKPLVTIPTIASVCAGNAVAPTATVKSCYADQAETYSWKFTNGSPATSTDAVPGNVLFATQGSFPVSVDVANECGSATANSTVTITSKPTANAGADLDVCSGKPGQLGVAGSGYTYSWKPFAFLSNTSVANPSITPISDVDTTLSYVLTVSAGAGCVSTDTVKIKVRRSPVVTVTPAASSICTGGATKLTASGADTYTWAPATGLNVTDQPVVTAAPLSTSNYMVTGKLANGCTDMTSALVSVVSFTPANAGPDKSYCSGQSVTIGATSAGMVYKWQPVTGLNNPNIANPTVNFVYNGPGLDTVLQYVVTASAGANCSGSDTVKVTVKRSPLVVADPAITDICPGGNTRLVVSGAESYAWSPAAGLDFANRDTVFAKPATTQVYTVTGSLSNGCTTDATATVNVKAKPTVDAGADTTSCNNFAAIQLNGRPAGGSWSGNGFISAAGVFNPIQAGNGTYKAIYAFVANGCDNSDSLVITVTNPPLSNAGADRVYCSSTGTAQLVGSPAGGRWSGNSIVSPTGLLQLNTPGIYKLVYSVGGGSCIGTDTVMVTIGDAVSNNTLSAVNPVCTGNAPATIIGSVATAGTYTVTYQWQQSIDNLTWTDLSGITTKDFSPPVLTQTMYYRRLASSSLCSQGTPGNVITAVVNPDATATFNPTQTSGCTPFALTPAIVNLTPYPAKNSNYLWYVNGNAIGSGDPFPGYTLSKSSDTIQLTLVAVSRFGCVNDTASVIFTTPPTPVPSFTLSDTVGCGPLDITVTNTTPDADLFSFTWDFGTGETSSLTHPGIISFPINPSYGDTTYTVSLKAFTGCDTVAFTQTIRVRAKPKALFTPSSVQGCSPMPVTFTNTSRGSNSSFTWDFGDGSPQEPATQPSINHTFYTGALDTFFVQLYGQNDCGIDTQQYAIVVNPNSIKLNVAVNGNQINGCAPHNVLFVNNTKGANLFRWNFGDNSPELTSTKGVDSVWHVYTNPGTYKVTLFATNSCNDTSTTITITVETKPNVSFEIKPNTVCVGDPVSLANTSETGLAWNWRFGDSTTSSTASPVKSYTAAGSYRIVLTGRKTFAQGFGCSDSSFADIIVRDTVAGNYTVDSSGSCVPMIVVFKNSNRPSINTVWDFGDGSTAKGDSVDHTYQSQGRYQAVMVAQSPGGCRYRDVKTIVVNGPSGELRYRGGYVCPPGAVQFDVVSNNTSVYRFYFGNGDSLVTANPAVAYTYPKPGTYLPSVILQTGSCSRLLKGTDSVRIETISAGFAIDTVQKCGATTVNFRDTSKAYFAITKWEWSFGDGTASTQRNPVKIFRTSGVYNVQLRITSASGCTSDITVPVAVKVRSIPVSQIYTSQLYCTANPIVFTALVNSDDPITATTWNFGNGSTASGNPVSFAYAATGTYTVTLISRTGFGCADTVKKAIVVNQSPVVSAGPGIRLCLGQSAQLNANGSTQLQWSPSQGLSCNACASPVAKPNVTTRYAVTGTNAIGCPNTDSILVEVIQPFTMSLTPNDTICIGQSMQLFASNASFYRWNPAVGLNASNIPNPLATPQSTTKYTVVGFDDYNCFTDTGTVTIAVGQYPTVDLGTGSTVVAGTQVQLQPALTNGPFRKYTWTPNDLLSCTNCANPVATINLGVTYQLTAENIYGCSGSDTITYQVICSKDDQVYIPNAFSPDGDGVNDVFMLHGKGVKVDYFRVYNRWGQLVFDGGSNYQPNLPQYGWDGRINGKPATQDVYVYSVQVRCSAGGTFTYKGNVSLLLVR